MELAMTWRTRARHARSTALVSAAAAAAVDYSTLIARRKAVVALVKAGVVGDAPSLDSAPPAGQERSWFDAMKVEVSAQLDTIAGWIKSGTAKAKAKAALDAIRPELEELDKVAKLAILASPAAPLYVVTDLTKRTADLVDELGGVKTVGNIVLLLAALWAWHKWG
jgi:hypothetical protein